MKFAIPIGRHTVRMRHFLVAVGILCGIGILAGTLVLLRHDRQNELRTEDARGRLEIVEWTFFAYERNRTVQPSRKALLPAQPQPVPA